MYYCIVLCPCVATSQHDVLHKILISLYICTPEQVLHTPRMGMTAMLGLVQRTITAFLL